MHVMMTNQVDEYKPRWNDVKGYIGWEETIGISQKDLNNNIVVGEGEK